MFCIVAGPIYIRFLVSSDSKASAYNTGDPCLIPGLERPTGEGSGNPLQYSCLENPMENPRSGTAGSYGSSIF